MSDLPRVHVHMTVSDLSKSREFYTRFFGVTPVDAVSAPTGAMKGLRVVSSGGCCAPA